jgi:hypothetical protein
MIDERTKGFEGFDTFVGGAKAKGLSIAIGISCHKIRIQHSKVRDCNYNGGVCLLHAVANPFFVALINIQARGSVGKCFLNGQDCAALQKQNRYHIQALKGLFVLPILILSSVVV